MGPTSTEQLHWIKAWREQRPPVRKERSRNKVVQQRLDYIKSLKSGDPVEWWGNTKNSRSKEIKQGVFDVLAPNTDGEYCYVKMRQTQQAFAGDKKGPGWLRFRIQTKNIIVPDGED